MSRLQRALRKTHNRVIESGAPKVVSRRRKMLEFSKLVNTMLCGINDKGGLELIINSSGKKLLNDLESFLDEECLKT